MSDVIVRRILDDDGGMRFCIEVGLDRVQVLPGSDPTTFRMKQSDASAGVDSPSTLVAVLRQLGGDQWRADLTWDIVDERGGLIGTFDSFSARGGSFDSLR